MVAHPTQAPQRSNTENRKAAPHVPPLPWGETPEAPTGVPTQADLTPTWRVRLPAHVGPLWGAPPTAAGRRTRERISPPFQWQVAGGGRKFRPRPGPPGPARVPSFAERVTVPTSLNLLSAPRHTRFSLGRTRARRRSAGCCTHSALEPKCGGGVRAGRGPGRNTLPHRPRPAVRGLRCEGVRPCACEPKLL